MPLTPRDSKNIIIALSVVTIVGLFTYVMMTSDRDGTLTLKVGDNKVAMQFKGKNIEWREFINHVFADDFRRKEALAILRDTYQLYERSSPYLVFSFRNELGETELSKSLRELLFELKGPFQRQYHAYYDITDLTVIDALIDLGYNHPVAEKLRDLKDSFQGMFSEVGIEANIVIDIDGRILDGHAAVCAGSKYRGRNLLIFNPDNLLTPLSVVVSETFFCPRVPSNSTNGDDIPLIKINRHDGTRLFEGNPPHNTERLIMYPAPPGYTVKPQITGMVATN